MVRAIWQESSNGRESPMCCGSVPDFGCFMRALAHST
jgi:hypothetical protein